MKLEPKAKPVRIRIKSGDEEHFSLDSLKRNFSVQDLWAAVQGKSLSRWLKQQNEKELAEKVDAFYQIEKPSVEEYIGFSGLFFEKELGGHPFEDADALFVYYQKEHLTKNLYYALSYILDSMEVDYKTGRAWYDSYREWVSVGEWIDSFKAKWMHLEGVEEVEYYYFLSTLYEKNNDSAERGKNQAKSKELLYGLVKENMGSANELLKTNEFFFVETLFENKTARKTKSDKEWIAIFERCKNQLNTTQRAECCYYLYSLYKAIGDTDHAVVCLEESANLGLEEARKELFGVTHSYPKLTEILDRYRSDTKRISVSDLDSISHDIGRLDKEEKYYSLCKFGIKTLKEHQPISDPIRRKSEILSQDAIKFSLESKINTTVACYFPEYKPLMNLIGALSFEFQFDSVELYSRNDGKIDDFSPYKLIFDLKQNGQKSIIVSEKGSRCNLKDDSIVEQLFFFLETHGEQYSILKQN